MKSKFKKPYLYFIFFLIIVPWMNNETSNEVVVPPISQESNAFYEINPCKVSLFKFIQENPQSIYQDHYKFRPNDYSSISCFGRISGVTVLQQNGETEFYISVGTNSFVNLILQGFVWLIFFSLIPKNSSINYKLYKNPLTQLFILSGSLIFCFGIYAQNKYYENYLYVFDFLDKKSYLLIFLIFFLLIKLTVDIYSTRNEQLINYLPYLFLISGIFSGFNLNFYSLLFVTLGLFEVFKNNYLKKFNKYYISLSIWWLFNSHGSFSFKVGKLRSFTSSSYDFNSNLFWIIFFFLLINGFWFLISNSKSSFCIDTFTNNLSIAATIILSLGLIGSNFPIFSFFSYYYLGLQRYVVELSNPFLFDEFLVKVSWRGLFPSAETIGEFYGICLLFLLFSISKNQKISKLNIVGIIFASFGIYFSDNKTSIALVFIFLLIYIYIKYFKNVLNSKIIVQSIIIITVLAILAVFIGSSSIQTSYKFASLSLVQKAFSSQYDSVYSSFLLLLEDSYKNSTLFENIFSFVGVIAFVLNRSEMWGMFFARFNPTFMELLFGSGPLNFGQLYGESLINKNDSLFLPHSSILSWILFIGIIPVFIFILFSISKIIKKRMNLEFVLIFIFILLNIFKNDSLNYFANFALYFCLIFLMENKELDSSK